METRKAIMQYRKNGTLMEGYEVREYIDPLGRTVTEIRPSGGPSWYWVETN